MKASGVYKIQNVITGDTYIGQSAEISDRRRAHLHCLRKNKHYNKHLQNAWNKYGESSFAFVTMIICEEKEMTYYEQKLVDKLRPVYNIRTECVDSPLGFKASDETRRKLSLAAMGNTHTRGHKLTEEHKRKDSEALRGPKNPFFGKRHSEESLRKMSEAKRGEKHNFFGKHHSEETKKKMSIAQKGKFVSEETRKKLSLAATGKHFSDEAKRKVSLSLKGIHRSVETRRKISIAKKKWWTDRKAGVK